MQVEILAISIEVPLVAGARAQNYMTVKLPTGYLFRCKISDEDLQQLTGGMESEPAPIAEVEPELEVPAPQEPPGGFSPVALHEDPEKDAEVFGETVGAQISQDEISRIAAIVSEASLPTPNWKSPRAVPATGGRDEDGVSSL